MNDKKPIATKTNMMDPNDGPTSARYKSDLGRRINSPSTLSQNTSQNGLIILEEDRPMLVIVEDEKEYARDLMNMTGFCGFINWYFVSFDEKPFLDQLIKLSEDIDLLHFDLNMGTTKHQDFIARDAILRVKDRMNGPQVGIASHYASDQAEYYQSDIPPVGWNISYYLPKQAISDELLLAVILSSSRLREVGRLLANGNGSGKYETDTGYMTAVRKTHKRLVQYLLPFDASLNMWVMKRYTKLIEYLDLQETKRVSTSIKEEGLKIAKELALAEMLNLQTANELALSELNRLALQQPVQRSIYQIEIILPKYSRMGQKFEVTLLFNELEYQAGDDRQQLRDLSITAVVTGPDFVIRDAVRSTGWPSNSRTPMTFLVTPQQLGWRGLRFEFFSGATKVAETTCRTLVTKPELFPE